MHEDVLENTSTTSMRHWIYKSLRANLSLVLEFREECLIQKLLKFTCELLSCLLISDPDDLPSRKATTKRMFVYLLRESLSGLMMQYCVATSSMVRRVRN